MKIRLSLKELDLSEVALSPEMQRATNAVAEQVRVLGQTLTPIGRNHTDEADPRMKESWGTDEYVEDIAGRRTPRRATRVVVENEGALAWEIGHDGKPGARILSKAAGIVADMTPGAKHTSPGWGRE